MDALDGVERGIILGIWGDGGEDAAHGVRIVDVVDVDVAVGVCAAAAGGKLVNNHLLYDLVKFLGRGGGDSVGNDEVAISMPRAKLCSGEVALEGYSGYWFWGLRRRFSCRVVEASDNSSIAAV